MLPVCWGLPAHAALQRLETIMNVKLCAPVHLCTCALCALLALLALLVGLTPLLQCAKQAGKTVMRFISATIMTLVEGGRAVFNSMERVRLDKIK